MLLAALQVIITTISNSYGLLVLGDITTQIIQNDIRELLQVEVLLFITMTTVKAPFLQSFMLLFIQLRRINLDLHLGRFQISQGYRIYP